MEVSRTEITRLVHSSPEVVYEWLELNRPIPNDGIFDSDARRNLEERLLERKDQLINLGLALFGHCGEIGAALYKTGNEEIKEAALSGSTVGMGLDKGWIEKLGVIETLVDNLKVNEYLLRALFGNECLKDSLLCELFEKKGVFVDVPDDDWIVLLIFASGNKRLETPYNEVYLDGFHDYSYHKVFDTAWLLLDRLEANKNNARVLTELTAKLVPRPFSDIKIPDMLRKWQDEENANDSPSKYPSMYNLLRRNIAKLVSPTSQEFYSLKSKNDSALKYSYYSRYRPTTADEMRDDFEKDGELFVDGALDNEYIFRRPNLRDALSDICWNVPDKNHYMDYPNYYNARIVYYEKQNPEWFFDTDCVVNDEQVQRNVLTHVSDHVLLSRTQNRWYGPVIGFILGFVVMHLLKS